MTACQATAPPRSRRPWIIGLLLVASLLLNLALLGALHGSFVTLQLARVFPIGVPEPKRLMTTLNGLPLLIMAGDSRALFESCCVP